MTRMVLASEGDGHDEDGQRHVAASCRVVHEVQVEQAQGFQREQGVQAGAGVGHQQLVLADLQDDAGAADRVAQVQQRARRRRTPPSSWAW
jgi:hypothetical protein